MRQPLASRLAPPRILQQNWAPLVLVLACVLAYAGTLDGEFVWVDEAELLEGGYRLDQPRDLLRVWTLALDQYLHRNASTAPSRGGYWRPVYAILISLDWWLFRAEPFGYHLLNTAWHVAVVLGLYAFGRRILSHGPNARLAVFVATLVFAVHPLGTHSVAWISGRKDTTCSAFAVGALLALTQVVRRRSSESSSRLWRWSLLSLVLLFLALGCKELAAMTPVAGLLLVCYNWRRDEPRLAGSRVGLITVAGMFGLLGAVIVYRAAALGGAALNAEYPAETVLGNVAMSARLLWHYTGLVLGPRRPLVSDAWPIIENPGAMDYLAIAGVAAVVPLLAWGTWRRWAWMPGLLWFSIWLVPATGLVPLRHVRAERYLYPASWGLPLAISVAVVQTPLWERSRKFRLLGKLLLVGYAVYALSLTIWGNTYWHDEATLFADSVARSPAHLEGRAALARHALDRKEYAAAIRHTEQLLAMAGRGDHTGYWSPWVAYSNLGLAYYHRGTAAKRRAGEEVDRVAREKLLASAAEDMARARAAFEKALASQPHNALAHYHLASAALAQGDFETAEHHLQTSLQIRPDYLQARGDLGYVYLLSGRVRKSIEVLEPLVKHHPGDMQNRTNLASAYLVLQQYPKALPHFENLVRARPQDVVNRAKLAWCQWETGRRKQARRNLAQAARADPDNRVVRSVQQIIGIR